MNRILLLFLGLLVMSLPMVGQRLTLDSCQSKASARYPLTRQYGLIEKTTDITLSNANKAYLPQLTVSAKATYQSDVTEIPSELGDILSAVSGRPVSFASPSKDQYQATLEISQLIWDGGANKAGKKSTLAAAEAEKRQVDVNLYALKDRINNLYFGVLLMEEQQKQLTLLKDELATNLLRAEVLKNNGVAMSTDLDMIRVEQINVKQRELEVANTRKSYLQLLAAFIGVSYSSGMSLEKPILPQPAEIQANNRPELKLFDAQINLLESQQDVLKAANLPKIGLFAQGGFGRPGLNMFINTFSPYAIGGIKLSWQLGNVYTLKNNRQKISLNQEQVSVQRETFLFNNSLQDKQQLNEIERLRETLKNDDELIRLRSGIKKSAQAKWENGTLTTSDLMREVNAENMAQQTKSLHEIQLYLAIYQLMTTSNQTRPSTH